MRAVRKQTVGLGGSLITTPKPLVDEQVPDRAWLLGTIDFEPTTSETAATQRFGKKAVHATELPGSGGIRSLYKHYVKGAAPFVLCSRNSVDGTSQNIFKDYHPVPFITGFRPSADIAYIPFSVVDEDWLFITDGYNHKKTNGRIVYDWGNAPPVRALSLAPGGPGKPNGTYRFKVRFGYGPTGAPTPWDDNLPIWGWSNFSPPAEITVTNQKIVVSSIPVGAPGTAVVWRQIVVTEANNPSYYYILDTIKDNTTTTKTYDFEDYDLIHEITVDDEHNEGPPRGCMIYASYGDRLWAAGDGSGFVYYSKPLKPDCWNLLGTTPGIIRDARRDDNAVIQGLCAFERELLIMSETKTYHLSGREEPYSLLKIADVGCVAWRTVTRIGHNVYWLGKHQPYFYNGTGVYEIKDEFDIPNSLQLYWEGILTAGVRYAHAVHRAEKHEWMLFCTSTMREVKEYLEPVGAPMYEVREFLDPVGAPLATTPLEVIRKEPVRGPYRVRQQKVKLPNICLVYNYQKRRWYAHSWAQLCSCAFEGGSDLGGIYAGENDSGFVVHLHDETTATDLGVTVKPVLRLMRDSLKVHDRSKRLRALYIHAYQEKIAETDPDVTLVVRVARDNSNLFESACEIPLTNTSRAHRVWFSDSMQGHRLQLEFRHEVPTRVVLECITAEYVVGGSRLQ